MEVFPERRPNSGPWCAGGRFVLGLPRLGLSLARCLPFQFNEQNMNFTSPYVFARMRFRIMPNRLATGRRLLPNLPIWKGEFCLAGTEDSVAEVGRMRMHSDLHAGLTAKIEHPHAIVF